MKPNHGTGFSKTFETLYLFSILEKKERGVNKHGEKGRGASETELQINAQNLQ